MEIETTNNKKVVNKPMQSDSRFDTVENLSFNFDKFLELVKKNKKLSLDGVTKDCVYHKIRLNTNDKSKIIWYAKSGKVAPVLMWSVIINRNCRVNNLDEAKKLIKAVTVVK